MAVALLLALSGCASIRQSLQNEECVLDADQPFHVVELDPDRHEVRLFWRDADGEPYLTLDAVREVLESQGDSVVALTNGGIYEPGFIPTGLYVEERQTLVPLNLDEGEGNFYLKPNGVFAVTDQGWRVVESSRYEDLREDVQFATQSGPLLVDGGTIHPAFTPGSVNCRHRHGVGVASDGRAFIAITNGAVNLFDFARFFRDELGAMDALYLDGAISELYAPQLGRTRTLGVEFAVIVAVVARRTSG